MRALHVSLVFTVLVASRCQESGLDDWRLPGDLEAVTVSLHLAPDLTTFQFDGRVEMTLLVRRPTSRLIFNAKDLQIVPGSIVLTGPGSGTGSLLKGDPSIDPVLERIVLETTEELQPGYGHYTLNMRFRGNINDDGVGFYRATYTSPITGQTRYMGATQLRPVHARRVFPCLDEPAYRSVFIITITHDQEYNVISNTAKDTSVNSGDKLVSTFRPTPRIPAFLVAFLVSDLPAVSGTGNPMFRGMAVPQKLQDMTHAVNLGPRLARAMEAHLGLPYPHGLTELVALPRLIPVAMENWALFTFREGNVLYRPGVSTTLQGQNVARFVGHEVTHAWMGNPVTINWWDFLWLSEVFAMYYEYYLPSLIEPSWRMVDQMVLDLHQSGLLADSMPVEPLTTAISTPQQISAKFSGVTYSKGPALLRMVIHALTEEEFLKGFRRFLINNSYSDVVPGDLWNSLQRLDILPTNLSTIMDNWTNLPGYPVITVTRDYNTRRVQLKQATFSLESKNGRFGLEDERLWWVPLTFTTGSECDFTNTLPKVWLPPQRNQNFRLGARPNEWVLFNIQSTGFYRVNYDAQNWAMLSDQLEQEPQKIQVLSRALLLDDSLNLARGGLLDYGVALKLACYLQREYDFVPWQSALTNFAYLDSTLLHKPLHRAFKEYMLRLLTNVYNEVGFEESPRGENHLRRLTREIVVSWACRMGHRNCIQKSIAYVRALVTKSPRISVDVKDTALCTAVAEGGQPEWDAVLSLYSNIKQEPEQRSRYLRALGCTKNSERIKRFFIDSVNELSEADWMTRFSAVARRKENAGVLLTQLVDNFQKITNKFGDAQFAKFIGQISGFLTTSQHESVLRGLQDRGLQGLSSSVQEVASKVGWLKSRLPELSAYFSGARISF